MEAEKEPQVSTIQDRSVELRIVVNGDFVSEDITDKLHTINNDECDVPKSNEKQKNDTEKNSCREQSAVLKNGDIRDFCVKICNGNLKRGPPSLDSNTEPAAKLLILSNEDGSKPSQPDPLQQSPVRKVDDSVDVEKLSPATNRGPTICLRRLEDTEHFNERLKIELERWKEWKSLENEVYEVEEILSYSWCKETAQGLYQVKWLGWDQPTWEPLRNLEDCQAALRDFYDKRLVERERAPPGKKRFYEVPPDPRAVFERRSEIVNSLCPPPCHSELENFFKRNSSKPIKMWPEEAFNAALDKLYKAKKKNPSNLQKLTEQIMLRHVRDKRRDQLQRLKEWENEINAMSADDALLKVENEVDLEGPPRHMTYINSYLPSNGIIIPDDPLIGCECAEGACDIKSEKSCCPGLNGHIFPYTKYGKLRVHIGTPIFECNKRCRCGAKCSNRVVQKGRKVKLCIYRTSNGCGWGVKALENIKKGSFVVEYVGEVITSEEAEERGKKYDAEGKTYLFDLDFNDRENYPYTVDAAYFGNVSHFINHSCDPNLAIFNVWIDCLDPNLPRLCFFASRDISKGEQISFDYRQQTGGSVQTEVDEIAQGVVGGVGNHCRCGSKNCRKIIF